MRNKRGRWRLSKYATKKKERVCRKRFYMGLLMGFCLVVNIKVSNEEKLVQANNSDPSMAFKDS